MRKRKFKRILSLLLAMFMVAGMIPLSVMSAAAEEAKEVIVHVENAMESVAEDFVRTTNESMRKVGDRLKFLVNLSANSDFEYEVLSDGTAKITDYTGMSTELIIPSEIDGYKVTSIGGDAFRDCISLTSITIPNSVISIENAFGACTSLVNISVDSANDNYCDIDGVLFNKDKTSIIAYPNAKSHTYAIPDSVTSIGYGAFYGCSSLASIVIPDGVMSIGWHAFNGCTSLTNITIPNSVTSIGWSSFSGCKSLTSIKIPDNVTNIDPMAFNGCTSLASVTLPDSVTNILGCAFFNCTSLTDVYYSGSSEQWSAIGIAVGNEVLSKVQVHYLYGLTPKEKAKRYIESLDIIYTGTDNANRVTQDIGLETENPYGLEVKWSSSNINVISCKGNVVRQQNDTNVKISVGVYYEQKGNVLFGYSKTFDLIVTGTDGTLPSEPVNGEYIKFQTLEESDAVNLLKFISKDLTDTDVKNKLSDFYRLLVGDLQNQPEYEQKVKVAFVDFVYICINSRPISNDYKINFATTALKTWLDAKGGEGTVTQPFLDDAVEIIKSALKKGILLANGIELPDMPKGDNIVQKFFDWSLVTINSIGGFLAIRDKAQIQYLSTYLKNRDSEYLKWYLDMAALDITGFDGPQICEKLKRWGETIYQIEKSLESNVKTTYIAKCPVVMEVYDSSGEMIAILDNDKEGALYNPYGAFQVVKEPGTEDFIKIARLYSDDCYVKIRGIGNGEMNLTVEEVQNNGETKNFEVTLPVSNSTEFTVLRGETAPRITVHDLNSETLDEAVQMAEIDRNKYSVTVTSTDGGFVLGGEAAYEGSDVILTAYPEDDYAFAGWYENGKLISNEECISITLNENRNFHAVFYCPVTGITLDKANITLKIGESAEILPKLSPQNASNKAVSWKSSNPNVVSVDENGNVKAVASGSAIITAMTKDGGYTATCVVNVLKPDFNVTINGNAVNGDVAYVKLPSAFTLYKNSYATLSFSLDSEVEVQSVKWNYANWSQANPEANIESPNSFETIIRPNGKGIGARSTWITVAVTDIYGNVYSDTIKVRFYKWDWQI